MLIPDSLKQTVRQCIPHMRKIAAWADYDPAFGEAWSRKFSDMISDIEDRMLAEHADDGEVVSE